MLSVSTLIDFLMNLMRDEDAMAAFEQDPQAALTGSGLAGVTAQDVRDARLIMADDGHVRPTGNGGSSSGGDDPVREIHHTTRHYEVDESHQVTDIDQTLTLINIDDRDTVVVDSFNSADTNDVDVVAIQDNSTDIDIEDSFNEDSPDEDTEPGEAPAADAPEPELQAQPFEPAEPIDTEPGEETEPIELVDGQPADPDPAGTEPAFEPEFEPEPEPESEQEFETAVV